MMDFSGGISMRTRLISILIILNLLVVSSTAFVHFYLFDGTRTEDNIIAEENVDLQIGNKPLSGPTAITNAQELQNIQNDLSRDYYLANDIDCSETKDWNDGEGFDPIGAFISGFEGTFDGFNYTIKGLYIDLLDDTYIGLFSRLNSTGIIKIRCYKNIRF